jgi:hypothetical protein
MASAASGQAAERRLGSVQVEQAPQLRFVDGALQLSIGQRVGEIHERARHARHRNPRS